MRKEGSRSKGSSGKFKRPGWQVYTHPSRIFSLCPSPVPRISGLCSHPFSAFTLPTPVHYLNKQGGGGGEGWDRLAGSSSSSDGAASSDEQLSSHVGDEEGEVTGLRKGEASNEF